MAQRLLDLPTRLPWGTDPGRIIAPADLTPVPIDPAQGWEYSMRCHPKIMNYIHNLQYLQGESELIRILSHPRTFSGYFSSGNIVNIGRNAWNGIWIATLDDNTTRTSYDGYLWSTGAALTGAPSAHAMINNYSDGIIVGISGVGLAASIDGSGWSYSGISSQGLANVNRSDYFLNYRGVSLDIYATGISGGAVAPTTPSWGSSQIVDVAGWTTSDWILISLDGNCHTSADGGDTWTQTAQGPGGAISNFTGQAVDAHDGVAVAVGADATRGRIAYSSNMGASWTSAQIWPEYPVGGRFNDVAALGNRCWVAVGENTLFSNYAAGMVFSIDDGATWFNAQNHHRGANMNHLQHIWSAGHQYALCGDDGALGFSSWVSLPEMLSYPPS